MLHTWKAGATVCSREMIGVDVLSHGVIKQGLRWGLARCVLSRPRGIRLISSPVVLFSLCEERLLGMLFRLFSYVWVTDNSYWQAKGAVENS